MLPAAILNALMMDPSRPASVGGCDCV